MAHKNSLHDAEQADAVMRRLKRAQGQVGAVIRMIEEGRSCDDVVTQLAAASKAINTAAFAVIATSMKECIERDDSDTEILTARLQRLFVSLA